MLSFIKKLGPGLLFAGAAIGVSHLVQSTRAGAEYGYGLLWALIAIHIAKYPFFQFAPRYTTATGESIIEGYRRLGKPFIVIYILLTLATMFTIQAAVTMVTAGLAQYLFGINESVVFWSIIITVVSVIFLIAGKYSWLDKLMKFIILILTLSSLVAVISAAWHSDTQMGSLLLIPHNAGQVAFLIAFLGWMPAPLDVSIWQSLWAEEKQKQIGKTFDTRQSIFDFNVGYAGTIITGILFMSLGALIMYGSGVTLAGKAGAFAKQLIEMYTSRLGKTSGIIIGIAALTTMLSTTLSALDASPRAISKAFANLTQFKWLKNYYFWLLVLSVGTLVIIAFFVSGMGVMVKIATIISFLTAPFYAYANYRLISSEHTPEEWRPSGLLHVWSWVGILFLVGFSFWYLQVSL
jgi:Mn2+/Fe2+ NRAMP family transporter